MDYESIHGLGHSNFSPSPLIHRMPTVSASQALQDLKSSPSRCISSGFNLLDHALQNRELDAGPEPFYGGFSRGKVTEIYGPPGAGKTALGMQLAASALHAGEGVIWVDAAHPIPGLRFTHILELFSPITPGTEHQLSPDPPSVPDLLENLVHFSTPTLAHLIALFSRTTASHPSQNTSLIIIDSFSSLITSAFPRTVGSISTPQKPGAPNPSTRKFAILQYLVNTFQKLAATRNIAVVILSQCVTKMRPGAGAVLIPAVKTTAWEQGLGCRVAIFRDWGWNDGDGNPVDDVRLVQVLKAEGVTLPEGRVKLAGFSIGEKGLNPLPLPSSPIWESTHTHIHQPHQNPPTTTSTLPQKRKLAATDLEIPDSEGEDDEDYGWAEEDEGDVPPMPPQWQGSEDILVPAKGELDEPPDEVEDDEEGEEVQGEGEAEEGGISGDGGGAAVREIEDSEDELAL